MKEKIIADFREVYGASPDVVTRAPGRIEFIGNHTDYNGGTVLGAAIDRGIWVAARRVPGRQATFFSGYSKRKLTLDLGNSSKQAGEYSWVNYPLGVWTHLPALGLRQPEGFEFLDLSDLPSGAGMSSSAAIELASALAFTGLAGENPMREVLVKLAKKAENDFVGVPCGILDQGVSCFGEKNRLVFIDCRGPVFETVPLPADAHFWVFNTHTKHALIDGLYAARHNECMEAAKALGVGLLADVSLARLEADKSRLTETAYKRARHVVEEIDRVAKVREALGKGDLAAVGQLLFASHESSRVQFENSTPELDFLVGSLAKAKHVYGARLTGGGFGGAVMAMTDGSFSHAAANRLAAAYRNKFGATPAVLHLKTGPGAGRV